MSQPKSKSGTVVSLLCRNSELETLWKSELKAHFKIFGSTNPVRIVSVKEELSELIFIDSKKEDWQGFVRDLDREGKSLVLVIEESDLIPKAQDLGYVDDLLVAPFRGAEVMSMIRHHFQRQESLQVAQESELALRDLDEANRTLERILQA